MTPREGIIAVFPKIVEADKLKYKDPAKALEIYWECATSFKKYIYPYHQACVCCRSLKDYDKEFSILDIIETLFGSYFDDYTKSVYQKRKETVLKLKSKKK